MKNIDGANMGPKTADFSSKFHYARCGSSFVKPAERKNEGPINEQFELDTRLRVFRIIPITVIGEIREMMGIITGRIAFLFESN